MESRMLVTSSFVITWLVWGFAHMLLGAVWFVFFSKVSPVWSLSALVVFSLGWEFLELIQGPAGFGGSETPLNQIFDIITNLLGYYLAGRIWSE